MPDAADVAPHGPPEDGVATIASGTPAAAAPGSKSAFVGFNNTPQSFTVPHGVSQIDVPASGGSGGLGGIGAGSGTQTSKGGYGALLHLLAPVNPGDHILVETGGGGASANGQTFGAGGEASGDGEFAGSGGTVNSSLDGDAGDGGGGGTEVVDQTTNTVILDAAGGGGAVAEGPGHPSAAPTAATAWMPGARTGPSRTG